MRNLLFVVIAIIASTTPAIADGTPDARALVYETYRADPDHFIWKQINGPDRQSQLNDRSFRVVFVYEGRRYTIDHNWWVGGYQIWERPDGTGSPRSVDVYRDVNDDGIVDWGSDGETRIYQGPDDDLGDRRQGETGEHRAFFQERYSRALLALDAVLRE